MDDPLVDPEVVAHVDNLLADPDELSDAACDRLWVDINDPNLRAAADTYIY